MTDGLTVRCSTNWATEELLVGAQGFEPWTCRLKAECSTAELYSQMIARYEEGLEPLIQLKKTAVFKSFLQSKLKSGWGAGNRTQSSRIWVEITIHCRFTKNKKCRRCFSVLPLHYTSIALVIEYPPTNSPMFRITKDQRALPLINRTIPCCWYLQIDIGAV